MAEENVVKIEDIAKALGVEYTADEDANTFVGKVVNKQRELILNDSSVIQPIKEKAIEEAGIIAIKTSKKTVANALGLGYSNSQLAEKSIEDLITEGTAALKNPNGDKTPLEIKELQDKLISLNSEYEEFKSKQVEETEKIHQTYKQKEAQILFEKELINKLTDENKKYHVPISKIVELIKLQIQNDVKPVIIEGKLSFVDANGNPKLNDLKTLHYSIDDVAKLASDLEIKSNGRGEKKEFELEDNKNITDKMKENRRRLAQTYIE